MFFWVKKLLGYVLMPVPVCLVLAVVGVSLLWWTRRRRLGLVLLSTATVLLLLFSNIMFSQWLVRPLENKFPAIPELHAGQPLPPELAACRYVVVLGSGNANTPGRSSLNLLSRSAQARVTEAVRILRHLPEAKLVLSGPAVGDWPSHATVMSRAALSLGLDPIRIHLIEKVRDTEDESLAVKNDIGDVPFALVTTAWHMPRAVALFRHAGLNPVPCPTDFTAQDDGEFHVTDFLWDVASIERSTATVRERLGYTWIWLRGRG
jgi:uncharacterized SAM-binding protein YcdF (DUF218 family)